MSNQALHGDVVNRAPLSRDVSGCWPGRLPGYSTMKPHGETRSEAALVVLVPGADALVGPFRERFDRSALEGMLAHITINYPFQPEQTDRKLLIEELTGLFSGFPRVRFKMTELRRFPDTLYLAVEPDQPFKDMVEAVANRYPESPPYGRAGAQVVPHVTVAEETPGVDFRDIAGEFVRASKGKLPIEGLADRVWLMNYENNVWSTTAAFGLTGQSNEPLRPKPTCKNGRSLSVKE